MNWRKCTMSNGLIKGTLSLAVVFFAGIMPVTAKVKTNSMFTDHMVLQQGIAVTVWGTADEGEKVTVHFDGQRVTALTKNGNWSVKLQPLPYLLKPKDMMVTGSDSVFIRDVLVGEVWLCSGQSNMERQLGPRPPQPPVTNWEAERDAANYPEIREFYVPLKYAAKPISDVDSKWTVCSPATVSDFSAVGYFFAKELHKALHVPVGIIFSAFGGSPAEDWVSKAVLAETPGLSDIVLHYDQQSLLYNYRQPDKVMSGLYNGMIYPLIPYGIKGVAWYQGETNTGRAQQYRKLLPALIKNWRSDFHRENLPFLIVQIPPHKDITPELREAQLLITKKVRNTALIVTTDCGQADQLHPPDKQPVGLRLSLAARGLVYREHLLYQGPVYRHYSIRQNKLLLTFGNTGDGLSLTGDSLVKGFTIAGADHLFLPAVAVIKGNKVIVSNPNIPKPAYVRYGWANVPMANLYNSGGLPASPFRTDLNENYRNRDHGMK